jgi:cytochrome d ubiquinol oxidase subunit I
MTAELIHRLHFAFTVTFHYLFPQLTMGLALLIVVLKTVALRTARRTWDRAARFWGRIFGINFVFGVVTGIPMEFEFGTNWARFSRLSGGVIGQPLAMEGVFSFFLESAFLGLFLYGEKRISRTPALVLCGHGVAGLVDLGLLHHRYRRVDAASCWPMPACPTGILRCSVSGNCC